MADFHAIQYEEAWRIQNTLEVQKCFSALAQSDSSCHDGGVHGHTSLEWKNANDRLKYLSLSQYKSF